MEQGYFDSGTDENQKLVKFQIFRRLNNEILSKNNFSEELKIWLINKCERAAINGYEGSSISGENYEDLFLIFERKTN